jgi:opacity protein-like surface antigen
MLSIDSALNGVLEETMRVALIVVAIGFAATIGVTPAAAQQAGSWAVGGSIGAAGPADPSLQRGLEGAGNIEGYLTPRVSIRGQVGYTSWDITGRHFTGTISPLYADGNLVYNLNFHAVHPYVTAGVGVYHYMGSVPGAQNLSDTKVGVNGGGGVEIFLNRSVSFTSELLYHKVGAFNAPVTTFNDGSFWRFGVGAKIYSR